MLTAEFKWIVTVTTVTIKNNEIFTFTVISYHTGENRDHDLSDVLDQMNEQIRCDLKKDYFVSHQFVSYLSSEGESLYKRIV